MITARLLAPGSARSHTLLGRRAATQGSDKFMGLGIGPSHIPPIWTEWELYWYFGPMICKCDHCKPSEILASLISEGLEPEVPPVPCSVCGVCCADGNVTVEGKVRCFHCQADLDPNERMRRNNLRTGREEDTWRRNTGIDPPPIKTGS